MRVPVVPHPVTVSVVRVLFLKILAILVGGFVFHFTLLTKSPKILFYTLTEGR